MSLTKRSLQLSLAILLSTSTVVAQNTPATQPSYDTLANAVKKEMKANTEKSKSSQIETKVKQVYSADPLAAHALQTQINSKGVLPTREQTQAPKKGIGSSGGGTGCRAQFISAAYQVGQWLESNGQGLQPKSVNAQDFVEAVSRPERDIEIVPNDKPLKANGENVTARYDDKTKTIQVRCDRLNRENPSALKKVVSHELFRKMHLEGDDYHYTKQILGPQWAAANIAYSLEKTVQVIRFPKEGKALVKITAKVRDTEFFGIRECPFSAFNYTEGDTEIAWESCTTVGGNYYKVKDMLALQEELNNKVMAMQNGPQGNGLSKAYLITGLTLFSGAGIIYASHASEVAGFKQIGKLIDSYMRFLNPRMTNRQMLVAKAFVSVVSGAVGTIITLKAISMRQAEFESSLEQNNVTLKGKSGYAPFGVSLILDFQSADVKQSHIRDIMIDTIKTLEEKKMIQSYGNPNG